MSNSITYTDFIQATTTWGGTVASAWTEGAANYTAEATRVLQQTGQQVLSETQKFDIFATEQAKVFRNLRDTAYTWANAADTAGKNGIADIMRKYGDIAFAEADKVLTGTIDKKHWLDALVADSNIKLDAANKTMATTGGSAARAFGPIIDAPK